MNKEKIHQLTSSQENRERVSSQTKTSSESVSKLKQFHKNLLACILATGISSPAFGQENNSTSFVWWAEYQASNSPLDSISESERSQLISDVYRFRQNGAEFYGPYLEEFASLSQQDQYEIALLIHSWNGQEWPDYPQETIDLIQNLRIPQSLCEAILDEARKNGADDDWDIPAFEEVLTELRESWETESWDTFVDLVNHSPENVEKIYFVYAVNVANANLAAAQERLVDAQWRLVDAQWRLVDAQWRLVDAQWQLLLAEELENRANEVWESADALRSN